MRSLASHRVVIPLNGANVSAHDVAATLSATDLSKTDFAGADLTGADFSHADLYGANLVGVRGLDTVKGLNSAADLDKAKRDF